MHRPIRIFVYGFVIILTMMIALAFINYLFNHQTDSSSNNALSVRFEKINLSQELSALISNRSRFIQLILLNTNKELNKTHWQKYKKFDQRYIVIQKKMKPLLSARESEYMMKIDQLNKEITELGPQLSVLINNGSREDVRKIYLEEMLPKTGPLLGQLRKLITMQRKGAQQALELANENSAENRTRFIIYAALFIFISLIVAIFAIVYGQRLSKQLDELTNYLEDKVLERTESLLDTQKELLQDNDELARLASTDNLTSLFNRNHINEILTNEHSRYQRHNHRFGIILLDIDHFKPVNDNHGHDAGDQILKQISEQLQAAVRSSDHVGRWGGEEFIICCTTIKPGDIWAIAENVRNTIANAKFNIVDKLTVSLGCAIIHPGETINELIKRADIALYEAKNNGRNQSVVSAMDT